MQRLGLSNHSVTIERPTNGSWAEVPVGGDVRPQDAVRYSAHFGGAWYKPDLPNRASFTVTDQAGSVVWGGEQTLHDANIAGNAWADATAPAIEGQYQLNVRSDPFGPFRGSHDVVRAFGVFDDAPAVLKDRSGLGLSWPLIAIILGLMLAAGVLL
jgi:hypothetical protein